MFEIVMRRYNSILYKTGRAYGYNHHDTEDLMQETYINAFQSLAKFENRSSFKTWLLRIMLNLCYHKVHKYSYRNEQITDVSDHYKPEMMFETSNQGDVIKTVMKKELSNVIEGSLNKIPEDYRITFTLRELAGLSVNETAELMNTTTSNVKVRLNRAKMMLRKEIEKIYSSEDIYEFNLIYCDKVVDVVMKRILKLKNDRQEIT
jgi:RNA polymerase sigma-70 factor (ECF subfamily)